MAFVPTEKQVESLSNLLKQFIRENIKVRIIRFTEWAIGIQNCEIEVICYEDEDRYTIYYNGKLEHS